MIITAIRLHYIYVPYRSPVAPYWGAVAPTNGAHGVIVEMETDQGLIGWGETAGREAVEHHQRTADAATGMDPLRIRHNTISLLRSGHTPTAVSGLEMAMWDLLGKSANLPLYRLLGGAVRDRVPLCGLMGVKPPDEAAETARLYRDTYGFATIKTKAGRDLEEDKQVARAIGDAVGDSVRVRFDANRSYSPAAALELARSVYEEPWVEYFEEPCDADARQLADLRKATTTPIALNESVHDARQAFIAAKYETADYFVPELATAGGIQGMVAIGDVAEAAGLPCAGHCWHDFGIKTSAMAHVITASPSFSVACDTTYFGLETDVLVEPFRISEGSIAAREGPGLGVEVDLDLLDRYRKEEIH